MTASASTLFAAAVQRFAVPQSADPDFADPIPADPVLVDPDFADPRIAALPSANRAGLSEPAAHLAEYFLGPDTRRSIVAP